VPAELDVEPGPGRPLQVLGHDAGGAPVEGERRDQHPAVPDRDQVRLTAGVLLLEHRYRTRTAGGRLPPGVGRARRPRPGLEASGTAIVQADPFGHRQALSVQVRTRGNVSAYARS